MTVPTVQVPTVHVVLGAAGSGKSTIARRLAQEHAAAYLDKDAMSARFVEAALVAAGYDPGDRELNSFYLDQVLPLEYDSLLDVAGANLQLGRPVVLDAPFAPFLDQPDYLTDAARRHAWPEVDVRVVHVVVSSSTLRRRLLERGLHRDRAKLANWDDYWARYGARPCTWDGVRVFDVDNEADEGPAAVDGDRSARDLPLDGRTG